MDHQQLEEAVAAYALEAIDASERADVERALLEHLPGCASCRELFNDLREVTGDLALVATPRHVPEAVEERILEAIRGRTPREDRPARARRSWIVRVGAAAAAAALVGLGAWNLSLASQVNDVRSRARAASDALGLIGAPDARSSTLGGDSGGTLVFVWRPGEAVLVGHNVASPANGRVLQLWLMREGVPTSVGVFRPSNGIVVVPVRIDPRGFDTVAVTVERGPKGVPRPTGMPIYSAALTA